MKVQLHPAAEVEFQHAAQWYERRVSGLGAEFTAAVEAAILRIESSPRQFTKLEYCDGNDVRRALVNRFPYKVIYRIDADRILVLAISHTNRRPAYWRRRN